MIYDNIKNAHLYFSLDEKIQKALTYLQTTDFNNVEAGTYDVENKDIYAIVSEYQTKPMTSGKWESHKKYIDIQFLINGAERIGYSESKKVITLQDYNPDDDYSIHKGEGQFVNIEENHFIILFPSDIHMPGIAVNIPKPVKKVVVKVKTNYVEPIEVTDESSIQVVEDTQVNPE